MSAAYADLLHRMEKLDSIRSYAGFLVAALEEANVNWEAMNEVDQLTACRAYLMYGSLFELESDLTPGEGR
jgi:hypothetical protein